SVWFSAALVVLLVSIVICTLDRLPRLWRQSRDVRVVQPEPFFDPRLLDRARISGVGPSEAGAIAGVLRRHHFRVREIALPDGRLLAKKTIRVADPLAVAGFTFHQNGFVPAPVVTIVYEQGRLLWDGPVAPTDTAAGSPYVTMGVPSRDLGLRLLLRRGSDGVDALFVQPYRATGTKPDGSIVSQDFAPLAIGLGESARSSDTGIGISLRGIEGATILIAKQDPGQGFVWTAFPSLIAGLLITFYLPRRRVWVRLAEEEDLAIVGRSDRYVDFTREFGRLLDDLVSIRRADPD